MLITPKRIRYQWIYEPEKQFLLFLPRWSDINKSAMNLLYKILKSLDLDSCLAILKDQNTSYHSHDCLADEHEFLNLVEYLKPKWIAYFGELNLNHSKIYQFPHPNNWHQDWHLKKRIWLAWHDLKYKVL